MQEVGLRIKLDIKLTPELKREGLVREVIRAVQNARKQAGLNVDDRIKLTLATDDHELSQAVQEHKDLIATETLAVELVPSMVDSDFDQTVKVEGRQLSIALASQSK